MAKLLCINQKSLTDRDNRQIGDIVGVFPDDHKFSAIEQDIFDIISVPLDKAYIGSLNPTVQQAINAPVAGWNTIEELEIKDVWKDSTGALKEIVEKPIYPLRYENGAIKENYSRIVSNRTVLIPAEEDVIK